MEEKFIAAWMANREKAARMGVRLRPMEASDAMKSARRALSGNRVSDGFNILADKKHLELSLEALVVDKRFTQLFTDEEANTALMRLLDAGLVQVLIFVRIVTKAVVFRLAMTNQIDVHESFPPSQLTLLICKYSLMLYRFLFFLNI